VGHVALCVSKGRLALFTDNKTKVRLAKEAQQCAYTAIACDPNNDVAHHLMGRCAEGWGEGGRREGLCGCTAVWLPLIVGQGRRAVAACFPPLPHLLCMLCLCTCLAMPCWPYRLADRCRRPPPSPQVALRDGADQRCTAHPRQDHVRYCPVPGHAPGRPRLLPARSGAGPAAPDPPVRRQELVLERRGGDCGCIPQACWVR
jgi:hypothetical protein